MRTGVIIALVVASLQASVAQERSLVERPDVASAIDVLEAWIEAHMACEDWPGLSVGIVQDQTLIWSRSFGYANVETEKLADGETLYAIASNTKMFTAIAILKLRDEGKLRLDDRVDEHLPWFTEIQATRPDALPITIRHLLTHTSGLPREAPGTDWGRLQFPSLEEVISRFPGQSTVYPPETRWKYSNLGVALAGAIVSSVTGVPYQDYVKGSILEPLGMTSTGFMFPEALQRRMATGYGQRLPRAERAARPVLDLRGYTPAGGLWSSVNDLARFASWQFRPRQDDNFEILRASTLREMQRVHWIDESWEFGFGLGFIIYHKESGDLVGHGGGAPGFPTDFTVSPKDKIGVIVLANGDGIRVYPDQAKSVSDRIFTWVVPAVRKAVEGSPESASPDPTLTKYVGKYRSIEEDMQILVVNGSLVMIDPRNPPSFDDMPKLVPLEGNTFQLETGNGYLSAGERVVFEEDHQGEIVRFRIPGYPYERIPAW